ncbi:hypothetical protein C4D60_Mb09t17950 [Musa balbisiana]|uniref:Uncharacterized protein n=1 Tax=Musa balbisiana TaxID=52838 RepID=A0A4S8IHZ7_MUSBA|nr:hypothetical protein C4D60_Mb09t17950 [Musa balbisiana]
MFGPSLLSASSKCRERHVVIIDHLRYEYFIPPNLLVHFSSLEDLTDLDGVKHMVSSIHHGMLWFRYHLDIDLIICLFANDMLIAGLIYFPLA